MIRALALICGLQLLGEAAAATFALPVPGPVLGMVGLLAVFALRGGPDPDTERAAKGLLDHLGLLFVPAGVGVTLYLADVAESWPAILAAVIGGTVMAIAATALAFRLFARLAEGGTGRPPGRDGPR